MGLQTVNFIDANTNNRGYQLMVTCWAADYQYDQVKQVAKQNGFYIPQDQYEVFCKLLDIQMAMNTGGRQEETSNAA